MSVISSAYGENSSDLSAYTFSLALTGGGNMRCVVAFLMFPDSFVVTLSSITLDGKSPTGTIVNVGADGGDGAVNLGMAYWMGDDEPGAGTFDFVATPSATPHGASIQIIELDDVTVIGTEVTDTAVNTTAENVAFSLSVAGHSGDFVLCASAHFHAEQTALSWSESSCTELVDERFSVSGSHEASTWMGYDASAASDPTVYAPDPVDTEGATVDAWAAIAVPINTGQFIESSAGIASGLAFGAGVMQPDQILTGTGLASGLAFGLGTLPQVVQSDGGIPSGVVFGLGSLSGGWLGTPELPASWSEEGAIAGNWSEDSAATVSWNEEA